MRRRLCAAILTFEAIVLGLTTPVLISVEGVDASQALWTGLGLMALCILTAGMLRREWAYGLGWLVQAAAVVMGLQITAMFVLGVVFLALWVAAYLLGGRIDAQQGAAEQALAAAEDAPEPVQPPASWQYELVCTEDTYRPFAGRAARTLLTPAVLAFPLLCLVVGLVLLALDPGNGLLAGLFLAFGLAWPLVTWLAQRRAWKTFLAAGKTYRSSFDDDRLVVEGDGRIFAVGYDEIAELAVDRGLVSATLVERGVKLELPEPVFPSAEVERVRRHVVRRPPTDEGTAGP